MNNHNLGKAAVNAFELAAFFGKPTKTACGTGSGYPVLHECSIRGVALTASRIVGEPGLLAARQTRARRRERSLRPLDRSHVSNRTQIRSASPVMHRLRSRPVGGDSCFSTLSKRLAVAPGSDGPWLPNTALLYSNSGPEAGPSFPAGGGAS